MVDKKQLEKFLLLIYVYNAEARERAGGQQYQQGFCEMFLLFHLLVKKEHEVYWLFQFFLQKTYHLCPRVCFSHLSEGKGLEAIHSLVPCFCFSFQCVFKSFDDVWRLWEMSVF
ncbi:TBC1 domain family member 21 [Morus bassanus]